MTDFAEWKAVPDRVAELLPQAIKLRTAYEKVATCTGDLAGSTATWLVDEDVLVCYRPNAKRATKVACPEFGSCFRLRDSSMQPDWTKEILLKQAGIPLVQPTFDFANKALGGATPLSNAIVSGLMAGGVGYGAGALAEQLFPERYVQRGKLRRTLGLAGLGVGAALGANNAYATATKLRRPGMQGFLQSWLTPNDYIEQQAAGQKQGNQQFPWQTPNDARALYAPTVSVPQFNNAAWSDVQRGMYTGNSQFTPPAYAAATTGLMTGISQAQRSPIIRPIDVIHGIASAGVGLATATVAGKALSALAGLTPAGQAKLQDLGLWGGMMHAIVPSMFGR